MSDNTVAGREAIAATDRLLDDIDALVDQSLARPFQARSGYDNNVNQSECGHCENDWHGLPQGRCPGSAVEGPMLPPRVDAGGWAAPADTTWDVAVNGRSQGLMQQIPNTWPRTGGTDEVAAVLRAMAGADRLGVYRPSAWEGTGQTVRWAVMDEVSAFRRDDPHPVSAASLTQVIELPLADVTTTDEGGADGFPLFRRRLEQTLAWFESMDPNDQVVVRSDRCTRRMRVQQGADWVSMALGRMRVSDFRLDPYTGLLYAFYHRRRRGQTVIERWTSEYAEHVGWTLDTSRSTAFHPVVFDRREFPSHHYRFPAGQFLDLSRETDYVFDATIHDARSYR